MLASLQLENYRCFDKHEVAFSDVNVVVGANNAGKSTIVEALRLLSLITGRYRGLRYERPPEWSMLAGGLRGVSPAMGDIDLRGGSIFHRYGAPPALIKAYFSNETRVEVRIGKDNRIFGLLYDSNGKLITSTAQARAVSIPTIAILPQIGPLLQSEALLSADYVEQSINTGLASRHFRNQIHHLRKQHFAEFKRRAEDSWHQLQIASLDVEGDPPEQTLSLHVRDTNFVAEIGWMGHGLQMWLQTMWFLTRSSAAGTVILDEPDVYMHADLQRRLIRLLRKRPGQTIIATHSVEIMSEADPGEILIIDKARKRSKFAVSLPIVQHAIDNLGGVHNIHLARLWGSKRCLHVEGKDMAFLKIFHDTLFPDSRTPFEIIPCLSLGGWSGWPLAMGSTMSLRSSAGDAVLPYCIFDSDYHTEEEISKRYEEASQQAIALHIWKRKEIENYLIVPSAIARLISRAMSGRPGGPSDVQVQQKIEDIMEEMKDRIFDALAHEYLSQDRPGGVSGANRKARQRLEEAWQTRDGRYRVTGGKEVIAKLSEWAKTSFNVSFGPMKIARELEVGEVVSEMRSVIASIEEGEPFSRALARRP